jgi:hypothetical protein
MKICFWLLLSILTLMVGCTSSTELYYHKDVSNYWNRILYHQSAPEQK